MLTVAETARRLGQDNETIGRWIQAGRLPAQRIGGRYAVAERTVWAIEDGLFPMAKLPDEWTVGDDGTPARNWVAALRRSRGSF